MKWERLQPLSEMKGTEKGLVLLMPGGLEAWTVLLTLAGVRPYYIKWQFHHPAFRKFCKRRPGFIRKEFIMSDTPLQIIARVHSDFGSKFGIPRQSGLARTQAEIIFEPPYALPDAVRGLEDFSHLWLIWQFSANADRQWHPTVRPPRLGGNERVGVFASRSPFRPNPLGLSCVRLLNVEMRPETGPVLHIQGADLMDGTPVYDIKPYIPYCDAHPEASGGFTDHRAFHRLEVICPDSILAVFPESKRAGLLDTLSQDPRPSYHHDPDRIYGLSYAGYDIHFRVCGDTLTVTSAVPL